MHNLLMKSKVLVFDLDGTLYDGTEHYDYYAELLANEISPDKRESFLRDYKKIKDYDHALTIGKIYDSEKDLIISLDPITLKPIQVFTWEGQLLSKDELEADYLEKVNYELPFIPIGDGWWIPLVTSYHYGARDVYHCYDKTKEYMATEDFNIPFIKGLKEGLNKIKDSKKIVLLTNSDREDVTRLLKLLGLTDLFHLEITDGKKPLKTEKHYKNIMERFNVLPHEVVSIGDNFINEISPALKLGMHGIYITNQTTIQVSESLFVVKRLEEVF
ncbi:HAD family hydrolase [Gottfriedia luciferensis]|uniref:HAD family hydrolase n=1 Tax=Gottfriedia luciferensis TaxID=178774 RepID=UPI000B44DEC2|nr:HAD family hydrolase [Gottfriedia luciferensis]